MAEPYLQFGEEFEEGVGEGALGKLGGQCKHGLQGKLPKVCITVCKPCCDVGVDLLFYDRLQASRKNCQQQPL